MEILNPPPERLYRYRSARSTYLIDELEQAIDRRIYFSKYSAMNDPFEAAPRYAASSLREVRALVLEARAHGGNYALVTGTVLDVSGPQRRQKKAAFKRSFGSPVALANKLKKTTEKIFRKIRIEHSLICLSAVSDSLLMWAHYGCGHNGVVFEYEFDPSAIKTGDPLNPVRVRYASTRPEVSEVDLMRFSSRSPGVRDEAVSDRVFEAMWLTKSNEWAYEKEWRVISWKKSGYVRVNSLKPTGIIIGAGVDQSTRANIEKTIAGRLEIRQACLNGDRFAIDFVDKRA